MGRGAGGGWVGGMCCFGSDMGRDRGRYEGGR
jgi:hypothetical protein